MHAWADWSDWVNLFQFLFGNSDPHELSNHSKINLFSIGQENVEGNLKRAIHILNIWISKNVGSAEHTKAIKM